MGKSILSNLKLKKDEPIAADDSLVVSNDDGPAPNAAAWNGAGCRKSSNDGHEPATHATNGTNATTAESEQDIFAKHERDVKPIPLSKSDAECTIVAPTAKAH